MEYLKDFTDVQEIRVQILSIDKDVVEENQDKPSEEWLENLVHQCLKHRRVIGEAK